MARVSGVVECFADLAGRHYAMITWPTPLADLPSGQWLLLTPAVEGPRRAVGLALDAAERLGVDAEVRADPGPAGGAVRAVRAAAERRRR